MGSKITQFVIDRTYWLNADTKGERSTVLRDEHDGTMCCLGFCLNQIGVDVGELTYKYTPASISVNTGKELEPFSSKTKPMFLGYHRPAYGDYYNSDLATQAMKINDDDKICSDDREKKLIALFSWYGLTIKFIGQFPSNN